MGRTPLIRPLLGALPGARLFRAPGRVNLIGGQVDYHEGPVVAMAIDREVLVAMRPRADERVVARSLAVAGRVEISARGHDDPGAVIPEWGRLVAGVTRALAARGRPARGADLVVGSSLAIGGGLSSSAAFEVAVALALGAAAGWHLPPKEIALAAQEGEHLGSGVPCGVQDQMASVTGGVFLLDCRTLAVEPLQLPAELAVVIVDSGVRRSLAGSPWTQRRAESFTVAASLGLRVLRDASPEQVASQPRGRHVVGEMQRVWAFADALRRPDAGALGPLMSASHASSRDDMKCSIPALDTLCECLLRAGAVGARLTGGGFGGCCVALAPAADATRIAARAAGDYRARTANEPHAMVARTAAGAAEIS